MSVLVGKKAPLFTAKAVINNAIVEDFSLADYIGQKYIVLFFYPKDFTFVCPTELLAFQKNLEEFVKRDVQVIGCSTDTEYAHFAWLNMPQTQGGIHGITYPIVADTNKVIAEAYDVLAGEYVQEEDSNLGVKGELVAYRGLFLIDQEGVVQHQVVNNMALGRSIKEILRVIDALQHFEQNGEVCPMDWEKGKEAMDPTQEGLSSYFKLPSQNGL
ncbi:MAG: alkyl hydroperoxide reductase [Verrucomicrobia bacterium GWF2_51_19]|nr:MAG: alkyl hydroperoxide reductase [Verrucomicrobia bacterium GWF2_51_19]HCJ11928.1 alkyl hydroperoxide reductase [Opitutae bacterium]